LFLVEGYTDVIQFNQAGIENVVSSSGTALTDQIRLINRLTKKYHSADGDAAGLRAFEELI
jgi:DNA primase